MGKTYNIVFYLIILFIIVINILQFTWLFNSIQLTKEQYRQTLNKCLNVANTHYEEITTQRKITIPKKEPSVLIIGAIEGKVPRPLKIIIQGNEAVLKPLTGSLVIDTLESYYAKAFWTDIINNNSFNFLLFDSLFQKELTKNGINAAYRLDTSHIVGNLNGAIDQMNLKKYEDYSIQTWGITIGTFGRIIIWASFKPFPAYIYHKLFRILILNALILIVGNSCLLYILKALQKLKQATEVRNNFISNMTHELKTPVSVISTALDSLLEHKGIESKETTLSFLSIAQTQTKSLSDLIEKILTTSITDETLRLNKEPVNMVGLVEHVLNKYEMPRGKEVSFDFEKPAHSLMATIDKLHITNVLNNLIENAIKYSGEKVHIHLFLTDFKNKVILQVKDNGIGIEKKFHESIFEKFFRVPTGDLYTTSGTGLGLNYCKTIVEKHGGRIGIDSTPGKGSTFTIELFKHS
jgi:signal transduction histidine kinase